MPRILITITEEMDVELRKIAERQKAPIAALVREAITEFLARRGKEVESDVFWGRRPKSDPGAQEEGQDAAVAVA